MNHESHPNPIYMKANIYKKILNKNTTHLYICTLCRMCVCMHWNDITFEKFRRIVKGSKKPTHPQQYMPSSQAELLASGQWTSPKHCRPREWSSPVKKKGHYWQCLEIPWLLPTIRFLNGFDSRTPFLTRGTCFGPIAIAPPPLGCFVDSFSDPGCRSEVCS